MKPFLVFFGLLLLFLTFLSYQSDLIRFRHSQSFLKYTAEECAAGAALFLNREAYGDGKIIFEEREGEAFARDHLAYVKSRSIPGFYEKISCRLSFEDDRRGYAPENKGRHPAVEAVVTADTKDLFRLPGISVTKIKRRARYQWTGPGPL